MAVVWKAMSLILGLLVTASAAAGTAPRPVGVAMVLAVDASASISTGTLAFQLRGHAAALRDPEVVRAAGAAGMAVVVVVFSGPGTLRPVVPWTLVSNAAEAAALAARIEAARPQVRPDATALGSAIAGAAALFDRNGFEAPRRVIDIVSNGFNNAGPDPAVIRDRVARTGITINALAILDEYPWLESYYAETVVGGPGGFVHTAMDSGSFADALKQKLLAEIAGIGAPVRLARR